MENQNAVVSGASDTSVNVNGEVSGETESEDEGRASLIKFGLTLAQAAELQSVRDMLAALPKDQWDWLRGSVLTARREESDDTTKEASKLFQLSGTVGIGSEFALKFAPESEGGKAFGGIYRLTGRETKKGREGSVVLTLVNINDDDDVRTVNSRTDGAKILSCKTTTRVIQ